jgi:hypothetical protein
MLPDYSANPWQWADYRSSYEFNGEGELITSWWGESLIEVVKDLHEVVIRGEGISSSQPVEVQFEVDRSGIWKYLGTMDGGPRQALRFEASAFAPLTVGTGSTRTSIELAAGSTTTPLATGTFVRVNDEVSQVGSVTDSDTFVLAQALSEAPASGDVVYPSRPAGREFRLRLVLRTSDKTTTPRVDAVLIRYQNNVLDRYVWTVRARVEDGMEDLAGNAYPHTAADLRVALSRWATRLTPFTLEDQDGVAHTVKVASASEGGMALAKDRVPRSFSSVWAMNLVEVA